MIEYVIYEQFKGEQPSLITDGNHKLMKFQSKRHAEIIAAKIMDENTNDLRQQTFVAKWFE